MSFLDNNYILNSQINNVCFESLRYENRIQRLEQIKNLQLLISKLNSKQIVEEIIKGNITLQIIQESDYLKKSLLVHAIKNTIQKDSVDNIKEMIIEFLNNGADIEARNENDENALGIAVLNNHVDLIKFLIENNANVQSEYGLFSHNLESLTTNAEVNSILREEKEKIVKMNSKDNLEQSISISRKYIKKAKDSNEEKNRTIEDDISFYEEKAKAGDSEAEFNLGCIFFSSKFDNSKAKEFWESSAEKNNHLAQLALSYMYKDGIGVAEDFEKAKKYWELCRNAINLSEVYKIQDMFALRESEL